MFPEPSKEISGLLRKTPLLFCGFSGGADSTYLLLMLNEWSRKYQFHLEAVHFEHGLRGKESGEDSRWCGETAERHRIPIRIINLDVPKNSFAGESVETAARRLRIKELERLCQSTGTPALIALGHNADDRTENLFLRLARGSNTSGLVSMRQTGRLGRLRIIRPLLSVSAVEIRSRLAAIIPDFRIDSSNLKSDYNRNFLRNKTLPEIYKKMPFAKEGFRHAIDAMEEDSDYLEHAADAAFEKFIEEGEKPSSFAVLHKALAVRVLRRWLFLRSGQDIIPPLSLTARLHESMELYGHANAPTDKSLIPVNGGFFIKVTKEKLTLLRVAAPVSFKVDWNWMTQPEFIPDSCPWTIRAVIAESFSKEVLRDHCSAAFDADKIPASLQIRFKQDGDTMIPFGRKSPVKLKKLFSDAGVGAENRSEYPLLCLQDGTVIWAAGLRQSEFAAIIPGQTSSILILQFIRAS